MNYNKIKSFEQRYIKAINEAFDKVKNEFQEEFVEIVKDGLKDNEYICSGMGGTSFYKFDENGRDEEIENKSTEVVNNLEWGLENEFNFRLSLPYKMTNKAVLTEEVETFIENLYKSKGGNYRAVKDGYVSPHLAHIRYFNGWVVDENIIS